MCVLVRNALSECLHIGDRRDPGLDQSIIRCFEALLGWECVVTLLDNRGLLHLCSLHPSRGEKDRADDYITVAELDYRVLEPFAKCIFALLELIDTSPRK